MVTWSPAPCAFYVEVILVEIKNERKTVACDSADPFVCQRNCISIKEVGESKYGNTCFGRQLNATSVSSLAVIVVINKISHVDRSTKKSGREFITQLWAQQDIAVINKNVN